MATLRWGVLGAANIARRAVIPAIHTASNGTLVAIASRDKARAQELAQAEKIPTVFDDYAALLASDKVDAVYIPLPNSEHREWTIAALDAGKHVLCEKPLALNAAEAEEMVAAADRNGKVLAEAFMYRHHPLFAKVHELVHSGAIGDLTLIRASFSFVLSRPDDIRRDAALGGGALMDVGCYGISVARSIVGSEPVDVAAVADWAPNGVDESFAGVLRFAPDGRPPVLATFEASFSAAGGPGYEVIGTTGKIVVRQGFVVRKNEEGEIQLHQGGEISRIFTDVVDQYQVMVEDFGKAVLQNRPLLFPATDGVANMRVIDALVAAAKPAR
jgi:D-xylose 1-dehydrogenase (NADP+, D-xylono-1,5-lactone-forming)